MLGGWSAISGMWMCCGAERENCIRVWYRAPWTELSRVCSKELWLEGPTSYGTKIDQDGSGKGACICMYGGKMHKHNPRIQGPFLVRVSFFFFFFVCVCG